MIVVGSMWLHAQPGFRWQQIFETVVQAAAPASEIRLETSGDNFNLLILSYLASRHRDIADSAALGDALKRCALRPDGKILLVACDLSNPDVSVEDVIDLLSGDIPEIGMRTTAERAPSIEAYGAVLEMFLQQQLRVALPGYSSSKSSLKSQDDVADPNEDWDF